MKYQGTLICVADMERAKNFYENVMGLKVMMEIDMHVSFEGGLSLQTNYSELVGTELPVRERPNNFQLYFEVEDLESWQEKIMNTEGIEFLHQAKEYPWGQRVMRFYDYDQYIVEVSESMESVAKRFLSQGLSAEETAARTMFPIEYIKSLM